jgi:hypothetical protein
MRLAWKEKVARVENEGPEHSCLNVHGEEIWSGFLAGSTTSRLEILEIQ